MGTARQVISSAGTAGLAFAARGTPPLTNATEEFTASLANKTITAS